MQTVPERSQPNATGLMLCLDRLLADVDPVTADLAVALVDAVMSVDLAAVVLADVPVRGELSTIVNVPSVTAM